MRIQSPTARNVVLRVLYLFRLYPHFAHVTCVMVATFTPVYISHALPLFFQ
jgi:hypothetical protein